MIELGKKQTLRCLRLRENGVYLGEATMEEEKGILLPKRQVPEGTKPGDLIEVFVYKDSEDRPIATTNEPMLVIGEAKVLTVAEVGKIGAFLDWGLERDLFLPFKQQKWKVKKGERIMAALYIDKSDRLCATMKVDPFLKSDSDYTKDAKVTGFVYEVNPKIGAFVAVDETYYGLIPASELDRSIRTGQDIEARVARVREDGKLVLSIRAKAYKQLELDAEAVYELIEEYNGKLPFNDKSDPELIKLETGLSKNAFKRAVGHLLKEGKIQIKENSIEINRRMK